MPVTAMREKIVDHVVYGGWDECAYPKWVYEKILWNCVSGPGGTNLIMKDANGQAKEEIIPYKHVFLHHLKATKDMPTNVFVMDFDLFENMFIHLYGHKAVLYDNAIEYFIFGKYTRFPHWVIDLIDDGILQLTDDSVPMMLLDDGRWKPMNPGSVIYRNMKNQIRTCDSAKEFFHIFAKPYE